MSSKNWIYIVVVSLLMGLLPVKAQQKFFNLTSPEVKVDSVLPHFACTFPLQGDYQDSIYTVELKYPEYVDMSASDILNYNRLSGAALPECVSVVQQVTTNRKQGVLMVHFMPLVFRDNRYQILASFMLDVKAQAISGKQGTPGQQVIGGSLGQSRALSRADGSENSSAASSIYAAHSVLASGKWAKIRVSQSGIHQLTESVVRRAGFSNINKVKIYGYGGNLQNETLYASDLQTYDDLQQVPQCIVDGKHYFYAKGPVSWSSNTAAIRTRNFYSDYGYYFITESEDTIATVDSAGFVSTYYPQPEDYHTLYEVDGYSWYPGGRNLYDTKSIKVGEKQDLIINNPTTDHVGILTVSVTSGVNSQVQIFKNGMSLGTLSLSRSSSEDRGAESHVSYRLPDFASRDTITITTLSGGPVRLDYVSVAWNSPKPFVGFTQQVPAAEYVYGITNEDHHADALADMVIIIPTSQKLLKQAQRLKAFHESHDGLRVNLVPADELYNEFSSGTPDANAYRRYLRMLSDRATSEADVPKYLLLFGDGVWDNRMLTPECRLLNADDYLLCHESENSLSATHCYVSDSWLGMIGEGKGGNPKVELQDVGVGRFPVTTAEEAKTMVDKTINYATNANAGAWQNTIMFMADDGNKNLHMGDANSVADDVLTNQPGYVVKKVMWDAYTRQSSSTGNTYPEVNKIVSQQQANGALIMNYVGHADNTQMSAEHVFRLTDFESFRNTNLPLWVTACCDIMPFDGVNPNIGEAAVLNDKGGAVAFYGTARTVYAQYNRYINRAFMRRVLSYVDGKPITLGEAHRLAQNDVVTGHFGETDQTDNHLQYALIGDPALSLNLPTRQIVVDSINGISTAQADKMAELKAGSVARFVGHIEAADDFKGVITATVRDTRELVVCKMNDTNPEERPDTAFTYYDRTKNLYVGSDSVRNGKFAFSFAVPKDINYADGTGLVNLYAFDAGQALVAQGYSERFLVGGSVEARNDSVGPSIYCYLNSPSFVDGGTVNPTPYFVAQIADKDGINAAGSGIGHDLQLVIDGDMAKTYVLNDNFVYDFGTYTSGSTYYSIPTLEPGKHQLTFRAWDIQNNCSTVKLNFNVARGLSPTLFDVGVTENPARTSTAFIVSHDRTGTDMDVVIELYDTSGRQIWRHAENGVPTSGSYTINWDLTVDGGRPVSTGIYLYRVKISSDGSSYSSKTRKLIVIR